MLDGGASEVFLGGTRLKRFMESVETATGSIPQSMPAANGPGRAGTPIPVHVGRAGRHAARGRLERRPFGRYELAGEVQPGAVSEGKSRPPSAAGAASPGGLSSPIASLVANDPGTGKPYLKLPMPEPETLEKLVGLVAALAKGIRG